jgi:hypothetical protein
VEEVSSGSLTVEGSTAPPFLEYSLHFLAAAAALLALSFTSSSAKLSSFQNYLVEWNNNISLHNSNCHKQLNNHAY